MMEKTDEKNKQLQADGINITYFTDPLCCWSWALEPAWRKLQYEFEGKFTWQYCMGGLIPAWDNFNDPVNSVTRPLQMGPVWMHASQLSGMHMEYNIWAKDAPYSSYPACIAVKTAQLQGKSYSEKYLRMLRETVMLKGINISNEGVLLKLSEMLAQQSDGFDAALFKEDFYNKKGVDAFKADMQLVHQYNIKRFPTFIIRKQNQPSFMLSGYRPYDTLKEALKLADGSVTRTQKTNSKAEYKAYFASITEYEAEEGIK